MNHSALMTYPLAQGAIEMKFQSILLSIILGFLLSAAQVFAVPTKEQGSEKRGTTSSKAPAQASQKGPKCPDPPGRGSSVGFAVYYGGTSGNEAATTEERLVRALGQNNLYEIFGTPDKIKGLKSYEALSEPSRLEDLDVAMRKCVLARNNSQTGSVLLVFVEKSNIWEYTYQISKAPTKDRQALIHGPMTIDRFFDVIVKSVVPPGPVQEQVAVKPTVPESVPKPAAPEPVTTPMAPEPVTTPTVPLLTGGTASPGVGSEKPLSRPPALSRKWLWFPWAMAGAASHSSVISLVGFKIKYPDRFSNPQALIEINRWSTALDTSLALTSAMLVVSIGAEIYQYRLVRRAQQTGASPHTFSTASTSDEQKPGNIP
jgi:hypothetical protein